MPVLRLRMLGPHLWMRVVLQMPVPLYYASAPAGALLSAFRILQHCWSSWQSPRTSVEGGAL